MEARQRPHLTFQALFPMRDCRALCVRLMGRFKTSASLWRKALGPHAAELRLLLRRQQRFQRHGQLDRGHGVAPALTSPRGPGGLSLLPLSHGEARHTFCRRVSVSASLWAACSGTATRPPPGWPRSAAPSPAGSWGISRPP